MTFRVGSKSGDKLQRETYPRFPLSPPDPARGDVSVPLRPEEISAGDPQAGKSTRFARFGGGSDRSFSSER